MHAMRKEASGKDNSKMRGMYQVRKARETQEAHEEEGVKATIPVGEHPFDYLFEGHQFLMAGCLLLEEIDSPLEEEELEQIKKLLDPYAERIGEFYKRISEEEK